MFQYRAPSNTQLQTTTGGTLATTEFRDEVVSWVNGLETRETPFLTKIMSNEEISSPLHQWGQSKKMRFDSSIPAGVNNSATTITLPAGDGLLFRAQSTIAIYDLRTGSAEDLDDATKEVLWVKSISGDVLTVDTRGTYSPALTHTANAVVRQLGGAEPENGEHAEAPRQRGFRLFNYPQRFNAKMTADKRYQNTPTWEHPNGNPHLEAFATEVLTQKEFMERSVFEGVRYIGSADPANPRPSMFGGLPTFITTNTVNMAGATLNPTDLEEVMRDLWKTGLDGRSNLRWYMGIDEASILDTAINPQRRATMTDTTASFMVNTYNFRSGPITVEHMRNIPRGNLWLLDTSLIKVKPYKGLNWHKSRKDGAQHAVDHDVDAISGDFTLEVAQEHTMARIYNFDMNQTNYPSPEYY